MTDRDLTNRARLAEQAVATFEARERRLRLALQAARIYLWDWDIVADAITWAGELEQDLDLQGAPRTIDEFQRLVHTDDLPLVSERLSSALSGSEPEYSAEFRLVRPGGQVRWVACHAVVVRDDLGKAVRMVGCEQDISANKQAEATRVESEAKLRTAYSSLAAAEIACLSGTWDWDIARNRIYVSDSYRSLYGLAADTLVTYETWLNCLHPEDRPQAKSYGKSFLENGTRYDFEFRIVHPTKGVRWLAAIGGVTRGEDGAPLRFTGMNIDVTERRSFESGLEHFQNIVELTDDGWSHDERLGRAAAIVASTSDAILTIAADTGHVTTWNLGAERLFGYSAHEALHKAVAELILPDSVPEGPGGVCAIALKRGFSHEETFRRHKDGTLIAVSATAARMSAHNGRVLGVSVVFRDARQRRRNEAKLKLSEERLRLALEAGKLGPWETDLGTHRIWLHKNTAQMQGLGDQDLVSTFDDFMSRVHPDDRDKIQLVRGGVVDGWGPARVEFRIRMPDGGYRWIASTPKIITDEQGRPTKLTGVHEDITARKEEEHALRLSQARLKLGVEISEIGLGEIDYLQGTIQLDQRAAEFFDLPHSSLLPRSLVHSRFHEEDCQKVMQAIGVLLSPSGNGSMIVEHRVRLPSGHVKWLHARKQVSYKVDARGERRAHDGLLAVVDVTEKKLAEQKIELLMGEVNHRSKNLLSLVQALARQTFGPSKANEKARIFEDRLMCIAACQDVLIQSDWKNVDLRRLAESQLSAFADRTTTRIRMSGTDVKINATTAQAIGMALHELATNATKYGALSNETGFVDLEWNVSMAGGSEALYFRWKESGGPEVRRPTRKGFGQNVLVKAPISALNASVWIDYPADGFIWEFCAPLGNVTDC